MEALISLLEAPHIGVLMDFVMTSSLESNGLISLALTSSAKRKKGEMYFSVISANFWELSKGNENFGIKRGCPYLNVRVTVINFVILLVFIIHG